ncbi:DUF2806 domain-containing protein [Providencia alcalifaciens]|uniref:DUF2806 domain-containing protein n=1 Tax=Providencia TaxID=586 RepID=UPI002941298E|nr:DUF2806 domain-containing protein [Providencia rettgeri]ELR5281586.1 DUF2806 domain-containing protein [Providencia rettgeri]
MNENNIKAEVKADLTPIIESTPSGLNKLFELVFGVKYAKQKRKILLIESQAKIEADLIEHGKAIYDDKSHSLLIENIVNNKKTLEETKNILSCVEHAANALEADNGSAESDISVNFFNRWRYEASIIGSAEAQMIWGKLLAEEIKKPSSISLRTLDVLKNLSNEEVSLFTKACNFIVFSSSLLKTEELTKEDLFSLANAGLITYAGIGLYSKWEKTKVTYHDGKISKGFYLQKDNYCIFVEENIESEPKSSFVNLTTAGREIYHIAKVGLNTDLNSLSKSLFDEDPSINKIIFFNYLNKDNGEIDTINYIEQNR